MLASRINIPHALSASEVAGTLPVPLGERDFDSENVLEQLVYDAPSGWKTEVMADVNLLAYKGVLLVETGLHYAPPDASKRLAIDLIGSVPNDVAPPTTVELTGDGDFMFAWAIEDNGVWWDAFFLVSDEDCEVEGAGWKRYAPELLTSFLWTEDERKRTLPFGFTSFLRKHFSMPTLLRSCAVSRAVMHKCFGVGR